MLGSREDLGRAVQKRSHCVVLILTRVVKLLLRKYLTKIYPKWCLQNVTEVFFIVASPILKLKPYRSCVKSLQAKREQKAGDG